METYQISVSVVGRNAKRISAIFGGDSWRAKGTAQAKADWPWTLFNGLCNNLSVVVSDKCLHFCDSDIMSERKFLTYSLKIPWNVSSCGWFGTWNESGFLPFHLLFLNNFMLLSLHHVLFLVCWCVQVAFWTILSPFLMFFNNYQQNQGVLSLNYTRSFFFVEIFIDSSVWRSIL